MATATISFDKRNSLALNLFNVMKLSGVFQISEITQPRKLTSIEVSLRESRQGKINRYHSVDDFFKKIM